MSKDAPHLSQKHEQGIPNSVPQIKQGAHWRTSLNGKKPALSSAISDKESDQIEQNLIEEISAKPL
jgi:hypothetical protein